MPDTTIVREQRADGSSKITVPTGSVVIMDGGKMHSSTATIPPTRPGALGATATLSDANLAAASVAINTINTVLVNLGLLTAT